MESEEGLGNTSRLVCRHRAWTRPEYAGEPSTQERAVRVGGAAASGDPRQRWATSLSWCRDLYKTS